MNEADLSTERTQNEQSGSGELSNNKMHASRLDMKEIFKDFQGKVEKNLLLLTKYPAEKEEERKNQNKPQSTLEKGS